MSLLKPFVRCLKVVGNESWRTIQPEGKIECVGHEDFDLGLWRKFQPSGDAFRQKIEGFGCDAFGLEDGDELDRQQSAHDLSKPLVPEGDGACSYSIGHGQIQVSVYTLGGQEFTIGGCAPTTTVGEIKDVLQAMLSLAPSELKLLMAGDVLDEFKEWREKSVAELGLDLPGASIAVMRMQNRDNLNNLLAEAIESGNDQKARELIDGGAGMDSEGNPALQMGSSVLHLAIRARLENLALLLIKSGADIHIRNESGRPPLTIAAMKGLGRVVAALLDAGADPNQLDHFNLRAGDYADHRSARRQATKDGCLEEMARLPHW